jgi:hypothetical protein
VIPTSARTAARRADDVLAWAPSGWIAVPLIVALVVVADLVASAP